MTEEEVDELFKSTIDASNNEVDYRGMCFSFPYMLDEEDTTNKPAEFVKTIAEN